ATRTQCRPHDAPVQLSVWGAGTCTEFPSIGRLPSTASAGLAPLFGGFSGSMRLSDFPQAYMPDVRSTTFSGRSATPERIPVGSPGSRARSFHACAGSCDCAGSADGLPISPPAVLPSASLDGVGTAKTVISQLNGWPACAPVNASPVALQPLPHDSGSG